MNKITLSEICHPVVQGEGELIGRKMILMRVFGCPIQCPQCDSYHTWDKTRLTEYQKEYTPKQLAKELFSEMQKYSIDTVLITGGEPQMYREQLAVMIDELKKMSKYDPVYFDIETTGSVSWPDEIRTNEYVHFDLSPKIGSLEAKAKIKDWKLFENLPEWYNLKVVTSEATWETDKESILQFVEKYDIPDHKIYLMPLGTTREEMIKESAFVVDKAFEMNWQFSPRLHIFIFSNSRLK